MSTQATKDVFRIRLGDGVCRSGEALAALFVRDVPGIEVVSLDADGTLLALSSAETDIQDDVVGAVVSAGFAPTWSRRPGSTRTP